MLILVRHTPPFRCWLRRLGERLEAAGHVVRFEAVGRPVGRRLVAVERRLYGVVPDWDAPEPAPARRDWAPDLTLVLAGPPSLPGETLTIEVDSRSGEAALIAASRGRRAPIIVVRRGGPGEPHILAAGRPAIEDADLSARALETLLPRLVTLLVQAVTRLSDEESDPPPDFEDVVTSPSPSAAVFLAGGLCRKLARRFGPMRGRPDHWRLILRRGHDAYASLPDDSSCFRADPFLFEDAGRLWLFYEEYPYATGKGVIRCVPLASTDSREASRIPVDHSPQAGGGPGAVLEESFHLSYPLVLRHGGATYMLPESSAASRVPALPCLVLPGWLGASCCPSRGAPARRRHAGPPRGPLVAVRHFDR